MDPKAIERMWQHDQATQTDLAEARLAVGTIARMILEDRFPQSCIEDLKRLAEIVQQEYRFVEIPEGVSTPCTLSGVTFSGVTHTVEPHADGPFGMGRRVTFTDIDKLSEFVATLANAGVEVAVSMPDAESWLVRF